MNGYGTLTPWGRADDYKLIADGIEQYGTPSHGGYRLSAERHAAVLDRFPKFRTWAGGEWYEEDADAVLVLYCFPDVFGEELSARAGEHVRKRADYYGAEVVKTA